jgi:uncharacterized protein YndB with AHSA1/START domain
MITKTIFLACDVERAFRLFTEEMTTWWPAQQRLTGDPESRFVLQPNGPFYELARDGRRVEIGHVREWDPPHRLRFDFFPGTDAEHPTEVLVTFVAEADGTRLTINHGPTAASVELFDARASRYDASWSGLLPAFATVCTM